MSLEFKRISRNTWVPGEGRLVAYLKDDYWDDFDFKTLYSLTVFDENGVKHEIGNVKIGCVGQAPGSRTEIPQNFNNLGDGFFSLGQDTEYYLNIQKLDAELKQLLLSGLNDLVQDEQLLNKALEEEVTKTSLLRNVSIVSVKGQFRRLLEGQAPLTDYHFKYEIKQGEKIAGLGLEFHVEPESCPPTNIHVLIGRNGVGKTYLFNNMVKALVDETSSVDSVGQFAPVYAQFKHQMSVELFAGLVSVAFSAFDPFEPHPEEKDKTKGLRYSYVGLKRNSQCDGEQEKPIREMLTEEFMFSLKACFALGKVDLWKNSVCALESDPLFAEMELTELAVTYLNDDLETKASSLYNRMSSGHRVVLLTITKLVEKVEEKTLVLIDEPESHLHPPLLSAFVRALSDLLTHRNGVAIIATHSPVVVQEVPKSCVWKLRRTGLQANAERPEIETFGENVGILTREIFGLEVRESGYHKLLNKVLVAGGSYERIVRKFDNQLGLEARGIVRGLLAEQNADGAQ